MPTLEESALIFSEEEAAKRRPTASRIEAARAVMLGAEPEAEQVRPDSPWAKAAAEKPIDRSALPSASAPAVDMPGAVAPVTAPIKAPEGRRKGWRGLPSWAFPIATAVVILGPFVTWLIVRDLPPRHPQEVPAAATSVQPAAPVTVDGGSPSSVQSAAPAPGPGPSATTVMTSAAPTGTTARPERMRVAPKASSAPEDPYDPAVKPLPAVTAVPSVTQVAPPPPVPASAKVVQPTPEY